MKKTDKHVFFWGGHYSQWYKSEFKLDGIKFVTAEQCMMYKKAMLFNDEDIANAIMNTRNPKEQKALGRKVRNFDTKVWNDNCRTFVKDAQIAKYTQNPELLKLMMED